MKRKNAPDRNVIIHLIVVVILSINLGFQLAQFFK